MNDLKDYDIDDSIWWLEQNAGQPRTSMHLMYLLAHIKSEPARQAAAVADERARVVADLREWGWRLSKHGRTVLLEAAERIEKNRKKATKRKVDDDRCPYPGCTGVKDHVECTKCGEEHCLGCF